jgi:hypothetical protein
MAAIAWRITKNIDYMYLTILVIVSAGIVTLLLFFLYGWYTTGGFPIVTNGQMHSSVSEDTVRFFIGSIYVPLLIVFSAIAVAHRLKVKADHQVPPMFDYGTIMQMVLKNESNTLELACSDEADQGFVKYKPAMQDGIVPATGENDRPQYQPCPYCDTDNALTNDYCTRCGTPLTRPPAEDMETDKLNAAETDLFEQLRDPVNREKLVALLSSPDL